MFSDDTLRCDVWFTWDKPRPPPPVGMVRETPDTPPLGVVETAGDTPTVMAGQISDTPTTVAGDGVDRMWLAPPVWDNMGDISVGETGVAQEGEEGRRGVELVEERGASGGVAGERGRMVGVMAEGGV